MAFSGFTGKIRGLFAGIVGLPAKLGAIIAQLSSAIRNFFAALAKSLRRESSEDPDVLPEGPGRIESLRNRFLGLLKPGSFSGEKRQYLLFGLGGLAVLVLILLVTLLALNSGKASKTAASDLASGPLVSPDELFIPGEPDFLPDFLLERNPRHSWSVEDIRPYWKSPGNSAFWRGEVSKAVDKLMEGIP